MVSNFADLYFYELVLQWYIKITKLGHYANSDVLLTFCMRLSISGLVSPRVIKLMWTVYLIMGYLCVMMKC